MAATLAAALLVTDRPVAVAQQQPDDLGATISSDTAGTQPRLAIPDFLALGGRDRSARRGNRRCREDDRAGALRLILNSSASLRCMPQDILSTIPPATSIADVPFDRWREVNADGVVIGTVQKTPTGVRVEMKLYSVRGRQASYSREYTGAISSKRPVRASDGRRNPSTAAGPARRRPHQAHVQLGS